MHVVRTLDLNKFNFFHRDDILENILTLTEVSKAYKKKKVVDRVNLNVSRGDIVGFLGPNGAGKTTIIRMILGLVHPDQGKIIIDNYDIKKDFRKAISRVGGIVETPDFYLQLTGYQNLILIANMHPRVDHKRIEAVLDLVGLADNAKNKVGTYSLGMKQRLGIARALINYPRIVFLDEPMNGLDPKGMQDIKAIIRQLNRSEGITFFITSHLLHEIEQLCNKVSILVKGKVVAEGSMKELLSNEQEFIEVHTTSPGTLEILGQLDFVRTCKDLGGKFLVEIKKGYAGELNRRLLTAGISVNYLIPGTLPWKNILWL